MTRGDKMIGLILTAWLALSIGFMLGAIWATRRPEPKPPAPPVQLTTYPNRTFYDEYKWRGNYYAAARAELLDMLERGKW